MVRDAVTFKGKSSFERCAKGAVLQARPRQESMGCQKVCGFLQVSIVRGSAAAADSGSCAGSLIHGTASYVGD